MKEKGEEWNVKYECDSWSSVGVILQVVEESGDLEDALKKAKELRYTLRVSVSDMLGYFSRFKLPRTRNVVPAVSYMSFNISDTCLSTVTNFPIISY